MKEKKRWNDYERAQYHFDKAKSDSTYVDKKTGEVKPQTDFYRGWHFARGKHFINKYWRWRKSVEKKGQ